MSMQHMYRCMQNMHNISNFMSYPSIEKLHFTSPFLCTRNVCEISSILSTRNVHEIYFCSVLGDMQEIVHVKIFPIGGKFNHMKFGDFQGLKIQDYFQCLTLCHCKHINSRRTLKQRTLILLRIM